MFCLAITTTIYKMPFIDWKTCSHLIVEFGKVAHCHIYLYSNLAMDSFDVFLKFKDYGDNYYNIA